MSKIDGRKAVVTDRGELFTTYKDFAIKYGYPDAADFDESSDSRRNLKNGDEVTLLISGSHIKGLYNYPLWIVEAENGEKHIIGERGLRIIENKSEGGDSMEKLTVIDGVKYREVKRKAAVGERIKVVDSKRRGDSSFNEGAVRYVIYADRWSDGSGVSVSSQFYETSNWCDGAGINHDRYVVLEPVYPRIDIAASDAEILVLQREINEVNRQLTELTKTADGLTDALAKLIVKQTAVVAPVVLTRDDVVKRAADDIEAVKVPWNISETDKPKVYAYRNCVVDVEFIVNREKRTVVAIARWRYNNAIQNRGIAKCAPGDVFNETIGRAISLRRALGLEVPVEYKNAPAVEGVAVGDVVYAFGGLHKGVSGIVESVRDIAYCGGKNGLAFRNHTYEKKHGYSCCWSMLVNVKVIDDSDRYDSAGNRKQAEVTK